MPAAAKKDPAAATADEAQTEATPQDAPAGKPPNLGTLQRAFEVMKGEVYARVDGQVKDLRQKYASLNEEINNLAALSESGEGPALDPEVLEGIKGQMAALTDGRVTRNELADLEQRFDTLSEIVSNQNAMVHEAKYGTASATPGVPQVYGKVLELMRRVTEIGKEREADLGRGGRYNFRGIDQAMDAVGSAMRSVGLILSSEVVSSEHVIDHVPKYYNGKQDGVTAWSTTRVTMRYTFISPADGSKHVVEGYGVGRDNADKDGSKAMSAAMKYALFQGLCIPVQGMNFDPEEDHPVIEHQAPPPSAPDSLRPPARQPEPEAGPSEPPAAPRPHEQQPGESAEAYRARRATDALAAAMRPGITFAQLNTILKQAGEVGLLTVPVGEYPSLKHALHAISQTLPELSADG